MYHCGVDVLHVPSLGPVLGQELLSPHRVIQITRRTAQGKKKNIPNRKGGIDPWKEKIGLKNQSSLVIKPDDKYLDRDIVEPISMHHVLIYAPRYRTIGKHQVLSLSKIRRALFQCSKHQTAPPPPLPNLLSVLSVSTSVQRLVRQESPKVVSSRQFKPYTPQKLAPGPAPSGPPSTRGSRGDSSNATLSNYQSASGDLIFIPVK